MKVTIICDVLGELNNGTTIAAMNLIKHLKENGHSVTVVSPDKTTEGKEGFLVVPTLNLTPLINKIVEKNNVQLAKADKRILTPAIKDADVVHLLLPFNLSWKAAKLAKKLNKPLTASFHCQAENFTSHIGMINSALINHLTYKVFYKKVYKNCDIVHYPTEFIKNLFEKHIKRTLPSVVISNGVNELFFKDYTRVKNEKFTIVCSGRYSKEKYQKDLLKAVSYSKHKNDIKIVLAGQGPREKNLKKLANKKSLDVEFRFFGREKLAEVLTNADLYVHTSIVEIEAVSATEAIVCGLVPVICDSEKSATRFFAHDENNLYKKHKYKQLASRIDFFYENPDILQKYRDFYASKKEDFKQNNLMERMEEMLKDAVKKHRDGESK